MVSGAIIIIIIINLSVLFAPLTSTISFFQLPRSCHLEFNVIRNPLIAIDTNLKTLYSASFLPIGHLLPVNQIY